MSKFLAIFCLTGSMLFEPAKPMAAFIIKDVPPVAAALATVNAVIACRPISFLDGTELDANFFISPISEGCESLNIFIVAGRNATRLSTSEKCAFLTRSLSLLKSSRIGL